MKNIHCSKQDAEENRYGSFQSIVIRLIRYRIKAFVRETRLLEDKIEFLIGNGCRVAFPNNLAGLVHQYGMRNAGHPKRLA